MANATRATAALDKAGVDYTVHRYAYDAHAPSVGLQAAQALDESPARVLKTLMTLVDGKPVCAIAPSDSEVAMKKLAAAVGGKSAQMMTPADAERVSGYKVGGVSPFGQTRKPRVVIEETALAHDRVYLNGGQRGLQVRLDPREAARVLGAVAAAITA